MPKTVIMDSNISGKGIFASKILKKGEVIFIIKGVLKNHPYERDYYRVGSDWLSISENVWLKPNKSSLWRYINHSCSPNAGIKGKVTVVAMKKIMKGEEIAIDYSITEDDPYWRMQCSCKNRNCRKTIRSIRDLDKRILKKYGPYIPDFGKKYLKA